MGMNQVENLFLANAISALEKQLIELGEWSEVGTLYLGGNYTFMLTPEQKLTISQTKTNPIIAREDISPVDCYNFYKPMSIAVAVQEYLDRQQNPTKYTMPFFK